jgi:hypothetical protein
MLDFKPAPKTQIWYRTIQWTFLASLVQFCSVVSEKKIYMWKANGQTTDDDNGRLAMTKAHMAYGQVS